MPAGSHLHCDASVAAFRCVGHLGECRVKTSTGDIQLDRMGTLDLNTGGGAIVVDRVVGHAEVSTGSGKVRLREIDGAAVIKNSNGDSWVGEITGDLRVNAANGDVRIGEVVRGSASLKTACGEIEIGIHAGTAARLDVHTSFGRVHNHMDTADSPESSDETIEVHAHTSYGDILIRRS